MRAVSCRIASSKTIGRLWRLPRQAVAFATAPSGREPLLFTPGPLTTSSAVKQAMLVDYGSRDQLFMDAVLDVRNGLLRAAGASQDQGFECVIVQGSGTMGIESVLGSVVPRDGRVLILVNGAYGHRQALMCRYLGIDHEVIEWQDSDAISVEVALETLREQASSKQFTHVSVIHHETTAGVINPLEHLARSVKAEFPQMQLIVDSMSGFGAYPFRMDWGVDFVVSSANKCIEGVPGFSFVVCRREHLEQSKGMARSLSMDLYEQWKNLQVNGQFRFTPPTHAVLAFRQALAEWELEGGVIGRGGRYQANYEVIKRGMEDMGFEFYVPERHRSFLICTFLNPEHPNFKFDTFYNALARKGFVIYPGKLAKAPSFRFGTIGRLFQRDCEALIEAVRSVCAEMSVQLPLK